MILVSEFNQSCGSFIWLSWIPTDLCMNTRCMDELQTEEKKRGAEFNEP